MTTENDRLLDILDKANIEIHGVIGSLAHVVHPDILARLQKIEKIIAKELAPHYAKEEKKFNKNYNVLDKLATKHKFSTVWSMGEVPATKMHEETPELIRIEYKSWGTPQVHQFDKPTKLTWLEFWRVADNLIKQSGDTHHIFIESLVPKKGKKGYFSLSTGS